MRHDASLEILFEFKQAIVVHILDHIHEWRRRRSICKLDTTPQKILYWFLKSLVPIIAKDVATTMPQTKDEAITKAQQLELI
jgi:hypothetical protein